MAVNFLSARSWIKFIGAEAVLAGVLALLGALSAVALIVAGIALLASLWIWDHRRAELRRVLERLNIPPRLLSHIDDSATIRVQAFSIPKQALVVNGLKAHSKCNATIEIANAKHQRLAETIASLFELAGWGVSYNPTPQERPWRP